MSSGDERDAVLVRRRSRLLLGRIHRLEFEFRFGDLLLTCEVRDGGPKEVMQLSLAREDVEFLSNFLKRSMRLVEPCGKLCALQFFPAPGTPGPRPKPVYMFEQEPGVP